MIKDSIKVTGALKIKVFDSSKKLVQAIEIPNLVVSTGKAYIADRMVNAPAVMSHMALGTGNTPAVIAQTALETELARVALSGSAVVDNTVTYTATYGPGTGTGELKEAGIFNDVTGGTMLCRTVFNPINKNPNDSMTISWVITIS